MSNSPGVVGLCSTRFDSHLGNLHSGVVVVFAIRVD